MKKTIGMVALCVFGLAVASACAQALAPAEEAVAAPAAAVEAPVAEIAAPVAEVAAPVAAVAQEITVKGMVSVVSGPDGAAQLIFINPAEMGSHGYKVDLVNGEGKTLADKHGKIVEAIGVDVDRLFNVKSITVVE